MPMIDWSDGWKCRVDRNVLGFGVKVWLWREKPQGKIEVAHMNGDRSELKEYAEDAYDIPPTFYIQQEWARPIYDALHEAFGSKRGDPEWLSGKLGATERHLEDLRHMLKLPKEGA